jgi:undecaprenyl diphosphate synthase
VQHLAFIMDGNRRWAKKQGFKLLSRGHVEGVKSVEVATDFCLKHGIAYISFYAFSLENFKRSEQEKEFLFGLVAERFSQDKIREAQEKGVRIRFIGDRSRFPKSVIEVIEEAERATSEQSKLTTCFLFCYGGQQEIISAAQALASRVSRGDLAPEDIDDTMFRDALWGGDVPAPDLIVRTGGAQRLSNFLLYQAAYSELLFLDTFWPDMDEAAFEQCLEHYSTVKRNYGQ